MTFRCDNHVGNGIPCISSSVDIERSHQYSQIKEIQQLSKGKLQNLFKIPVSNIAQKTVVKQKDNCKRIIVRVQQSNLFLRGTLNRKKSIKDPRKLGVDKKSAERFGEKEQTVQCMVYCCFDAGSLMG